MLMRDNKIRDKGKKKKDNENVNEENKKGPSVYPKGTENHPIKG